jgi:hypothetical protein
MKWSEMKWNEMKWNEMKWNEMKWNEMKQERRKKLKKDKTYVSYSQTNELSAENNLYVYLKRAVVYI